MSRTVYRPEHKKDRSTIYGVFAILALLPTAFSVAFEYSARGIASGRPWLMSVFPIVLLLAARFYPPAARRSNVLAWLLIALGAVAGGLFCADMAGLLGFLGVHSVMKFIAPFLIVVMYTLFGLAIGKARSRPSGGGSGSAGGDGGGGSLVVGPVEYRRDRVPR